MYVDIRTWIFFDGPAQVSQLTDRPKTKHCSHLCPLIRWRLSAAHRAIHHATAVPSLIAIALGQQITKTSVINLGSQDKEGAIEENTLKLESNNSFNENDSLEDKYWDVSQEYYPNEEDTKPTFSTTTVFGSFYHEVKRKLAAIPQEETKMAADIPKDERKPAAIPQEEMKMAADQTVLQPDTLVYAESLRR
jgi:hypothetical protein